MSWQIITIAILIFVLGYYVGRSAAITEITWVNNKWNTNLNGTKKRKN